MSPVRIGLPLHSPINGLNRPANVSGYRLPAAGITSIGASGRFAHVTG